jgi:uncharacterized protein (DUF433 family)
MLSWRNRVVVDPSVLAGKPVVKGTRLAVEHILELLASGWSTEDILSGYPGLEADDIRACLSYAREILEEERVFPI